MIVSCWIRGTAVAVIAACASCTFDLAEVESQPPTGSDAYVHPPDAEAGAAESSLETGLGEAGTAEAGTEDASADISSIDGCWPPSDADLCVQNSFECGPLEVTDACGQQRSAACGACATDAHCEQGVCVDYTYAWATGTWSACSANCGGGTRTRDVQCKRDDGETVAATQCEGTKPASSEACNQGSCCTTPAGMQSARKCSGGTSDIVSWVQSHFGLDDGSPANQAQCAAQCTAWAESASLDEWCCDLSEDTTTGHSFSCAVHSGVTTISFSHPESDGSYASLGSCETP